jgi:hypothetical protein
MTIPNQWTLFEYWSLLRNEYPEITKHAVQLLSFVSTYCCGAAPSRPALKVQAKKYTQFLSRHAGPVTEYHLTSKN